MHPTNGKQSLPRSIQGALRGFLHAGTERNFLIILGASIVAYVLLFFFEATTTMRVIVLLFSAATLAAEMFNTAIEELSDALIQEHHPGIAKTKELAASAVLLLSLATLCATLFAITHPY
jgi:diacylglycerol kinase